MKDELTKQKCVTCHSGVSPLTPEEITNLIKQIPLWDQVTKNSVMMLERSYSFKNYKLAWSFSNKVSKLAEEEGHHPTITLEWGKVTITWFTHVLNGLHKNDFICAARTDQL